MSRPKIFIVKPCVTCSNQISGRTSYEVKLKTFCSRACKRLSPETKNRIREKKIGVPIHSQSRKDELRKVMIGNTYCTGRQLSQEHKSKMIKSGKDHWDWKGDKASYSAIHKWIFNNFGPATICENINCPKLPSFRFEYACTSPEYTHDRSKYRMLCIPCHRSYDSRLNKLNVQL